MSEGEAYDPERYNMRHQDAEKMITSEIEICGIWVDGVLGRSLTTKCQ